MINKQCMNFNSKFDHTINNIIVLSIVAFFYASGSALLYLIKHKNN